ncbi:MAG: hypothetical protein JRG89_19440 [Deltaproteobacteria bacterium]|nr:hypothetical protein [Deltaproteobacteria bacterium]MBW2390582.1 hypothetical protein [Deltaproteobacteria bacterium]
MTRARWIWAILTAFYVVFFSWYTSFGGPLSDQEIAHYIELFESREPAPSPERIAVLRKFMEEDTGDDFVMVNVIDMYETPLQIEGVEPGETSEAVLAKYMEFMLPELLARACHPVLYGQAASSAMDIMNADGMENWSTGAGMRYRSRRDVLEISSNPAFAGSHEFKIAAMRKTIAFPIDPWIQLGDPRVLLALFLGLIGCALSWREASRRAAG